MLGDAISSVREGFESTAVLWTKNLLPFWELEAFQSKYRVWIDCMLFGLTCISATLAWLFFRKEMPLEH